MKVVHRSDKTTGHAASSDFVRECVFFFAELVQVFGVPRSVGQIYGLLFASPTPLSFSDIYEQLKISKGSASQGLQSLRTLRAVRTVRSRDGRREEFVPEISLRQLMGGLLREKVEPLVGEGGARLRRMRECTRQERNLEFRQFSLARVKHVEKWRRQIGRLLPLLQTIVGPS